MTAESLTLSDEQQAVFERGYLAARKRAEGLARRLGAPNPEDIVQTAICDMICEVTRPVDRKPMPVDDQAFEQQFIGRVRHVAKDASSKKPKKRKGRKPRYEPLVHVFPESNRQPIAFRKSPDRLLTRDFDEIDTVRRAQSDDEQLPEAESDDRDMPLPQSKYRGPEWPKPDRAIVLRELRVILSTAIDRLAPGQQRVLRRDLEDDAPRAKKAASLAISVKTFDNELKQARSQLRDIVASQRWQFVEPHGSGYRVYVSDWTDTLVWKSVRSHGRDARAFAKRHADWIRTLHEAAEEGKKGVA